MRMPGPAMNYARGKKKGRVIEVRDEDGKVVKKIRLHKTIPEGCTTPKRICIRCLKTAIHKLDKNYDLKICKACYAVE